MAIEPESRNEYTFSPERLTFPVYALDGIGGCGKSHTSKKLAEEFKKDGMVVATPKIGGLGNSPRVQRLKEIQEYRTHLAEDGQTSKFLQDKDRDRIFRLATKYQIREFIKESKETRYNLAIIDRTPLMSWVFANASNPENPYIDEIYNEGMKATASLGVSKVFLLDVEPETAYSRMIARYCIGTDDVDSQILLACQTIRASKDSTRTIQTRVKNLLAKPNSLQAKQFESWDLIPMETTIRERIAHQQILKQAQQRFGLEYQIIDAEGPIESVVATIKQSIN
ncbi:MAG TPA: hypothetical protein VKC53_04445 [Patescibacteria group bacterium]|nr:hypothetical protein [Patescibacteria group bacterium]